MRRTRGSFVPLVSPSAVRRRARPWAVLIAALFVSPFAALGLAGAGWLPVEVAVILAMVALPAVPMLFGEMVEERPPLRSGGRRLTARTLTGERTVDLSAIATVRLYTWFSRSGIDERVLLVRDLNGVRMGVKSVAGRAALRRALESTGTAPRPHVSRAARAYLGAAAGPASLTLHTVLAWLAMVGGICGYMSAVLALADRLGPA